jgi:hypothetical protein
MKTFISCFILAVVLLCSVGSISEGSHEKMTPFEKLRYQVGWYESRNNHNVRPGDNGLAHGKYQFHVKTFNWMKTMFGRPELDIRVEKHQDELFRLAAEKGYGRHWTCIRDGRVKYPFKVKHEHIKPVVKYVGAYSKHKEDKVPDILSPATPELLTIRI